MRQWAPSHKSTATHRVSSTANGGQFSTARCHIADLLATVQHSTMFGDSHRVSFVTDTEASQRTLPHRDIMTRRQWFARSIRPPLHDAPDEREDHRDAKLANLTPLFRGNVEDAARAGAVRNRPSTAVARICMATITESRWIEQYEFEEGRGEHVRLDWPADQPPTEVTDQRAVAARLTAEFAWRPAFFAQFSCDKAQESLRTCAAVVCLFSFDSWCAENCLSSPCVVRLAFCPRENAVRAVEESMISCGNSTGIQLDPYMGESCRCSFSFPTTCHVVLSAA